MMNQARILLTSLAFIAVTAFACQDQSKTNSEEEVVEKATASVEQTSEKEQMLRHVVVFKFKDEASEEDVNQLNDAFNALATSIPVVKDFEWGINHSPEGLDQDFTHCYLVTFDSEEDRDSIYAPHPEHQAFVASLQPHLEKVFVVDYWTNP